MDPQPENKAAWLHDLHLSAIFLTRLPWPEFRREGPWNLGEAFRAFPLIGAGLGLASGLVFALASGLGLPPLAAAFLAVGLGALLTGGLHEDGLADLADGLGGNEPEKRLSIMSDSRIGSFGVIALIVGIGLKAASLAAMGPWSGLLALLAAEGASRAVFAPLVRAGRPAKPQGLGAMIGRVGADTASASILLGLLFLFIGLGPLAGLAAAGLVFLSMHGLLGFTERRLGGYTGDVLGAAQQISAILVLLAAAAWR